MYILKLFVIMIDTPCVHTGTSERLCTVWNVQTWTFPARLCILWSLRVKWPQRFESFCEIYFVFCLDKAIFLCSHMCICSCITDKIGIPEIIKYPDNSKYVLGSSVTLTCRAQGNPSPDTSVDQSINKYVWTFKAKSEDNATELVSVNGRLNLTNLEESSRGVYTCIAFNGFNGKAFNNSADIQLQIGKSPLECLFGSVAVIYTLLVRVFTLQAQGRMFESWFPRT